jgi:hypothetical protein
MMMMMVMMLVVMVMVMVMVVTEKAGEAQIGDLLRQRQCNNSVTTV